MIAETGAPLNSHASPEALSLDSAKLERACDIVASHIHDRFHPGAQFAVARHGKLALCRNFGDAAVDPLSTPKIKQAVQRATFQALVGFQLTDDQLKYNATR